MSIFASKREKRLWAWILAVVTAIYTTLGVAGLFADALRESDLNVILFVLGMLLTGATILTQGLTRRPAGSEIGLALSIGTAYYMLFARMTFAERSHLMEYSVVALLIYEALVERLSQGRRVPNPPLMAIVITVILGAIDEMIQLILPNRFFDPTDILFNFFVATFAVVASLTLRKVRPKGLFRMWRRE